MNGKSEIYLPWLPVRAAGHLPFTRFQAGAGESPKTTRFNDTLNQEHMI